MPIYEYVCSRCENGFEHLARTVNEAPPACPECGAKGAHKQFSTFAPAVAASPAGRACNDCSAGPTCPSAGRGCPSARGL